MATTDITKKVKMMEDQLEYLTHMNQRLNLVLGYAMGFIKRPLSTSTNDEVYLKYQWLCNAIENLLYHDNPLPPMP